MIIYQATNTINGHFYIGLTAGDLQVRIGSHLRVKNPRFRFHKAIHKYGSDNFSWKILATASSIEELKQLEVKYIAELKPQYNMTSGGDGFRDLEFTEQHKQNISKGKKGKSFSVEHRKKLALSKIGKVGCRKGKSVSQQTKNKISQTLIGNIPWNKGIKWKHKRNRNENINNGNEQTAVYENAPSESTT